MIRPHFATLGGFVLAVVVSAVLGMAVDPVQESASVRSEMDLKILIAGAESNTGHGVEIAGSVSEAHGCVVFVPESESGYLGVIWQGAAASSPERPGWKSTRGWARPQSVTTTGSAEPWAGRSNWTFPPMCRPLARPVLT